MSAGYQGGLALVRHDPGVSAQRGGQREGGAVGYAQRPWRFQDCLAERSAARAYAD
jgi:hypothetical protein